MFVELLTGIVNASNRTECVSLNNQQGMAQSAHHEKYLKNEKSSNSGKNHQISTVIKYKNKVLYIFAYL